MDASLFDMLHDAGNKNIARVVGYRVDVDFNGVLQKAVDENGVVARDTKQLARLQNGSELRFVGDNCYPAPAEHVGRPEDQWIADCAGGCDRFFRRQSGSVARLFELKLLQQ